MRVALVVVCVALAVALAPASGFADAQRANPHAVFDTDGPFGALTDAEWAALRSTARMRRTAKGVQLHATSQSITFNNTIINQALGASRDWHSAMPTTGLQPVTRAKNQGACGSCWIFSTLAVLETMHAAATGTLLSLSVQYVVDCVASALGSRNPCLGGDPSELAQQLLTTPIPLERDYEYTSYDNTTDTCQPGVAGVVKPSAVRIPAAAKGQMLEDAMAAYVYLYGPLQVSVDADQAYWQYYRSGILTEGPKPSAAQYMELDHGVTIVGYGIANDIPYWKIKNSWGPVWGEGGYVRVRRGVNLFGVSDFPVGLVA